MVGSLLITIVLLVWYIFNKNKVDYHVNKEVGNQAEKTVVEKFKKDWADLVAVATGKKNYFGN